ncbi:calcineurin [Clostridium bovifaecis]|uniref:Calcineurin n=1 Tax=Clostridium bovifaecis TaxID=2184719 RepID=A0A6I6FG92_9CLOT|nr:calcineurin [Clostridium bovifaecis]
MYKRLLVFGDSKGKNNGINKRILNKILRQTKKLNIQPEYIVHLGDSIAGSSSIETLKLQMKELHRLISFYYPTDKILPVLGNHEVNNEPIDLEAEKVFEECYSDFNSNNFLEGYHKTVYYKDFNNIRCIFLNSFHYGELHKITGKQLDWFKNVSRENMDFKIVFVHLPPYPTGAHLKTCMDASPEDRDAFWRVIEENNINLVFCGHEHNYSRRLVESQYNKVMQIITGGAGEKLKESYKDKKGVIIPPKGVYHYVLIDIEEICIRVRAISIEGKILDDFSVQIS